MGLLTRRELAVPVTYASTPLGHDARGREDLVVLGADDHVIIEIKQARRLEEKDFLQLYRYIDSRAPATARAVHGLLVLFGDTRDEAWYARVEAGVVHRVLLRLVELPARAVRTYDAFTAGSLQTV
jgi:RecB family endonuclease NucS